jgi:hypothetical protein
VGKGGEGWYGMRTTQNILAENSKEMYLYEHLCLEKNKIKI